MIRRDVGSPTPVVVFAPAEPELSLAALGRPFRRRWRLVVGMVLVSWVLGLALVVIPARRFTASLVLAALPNNRLAGASLGGGLSALLGSVQLGGLQSTPYFVTRLLLLRGVIMGVALEPVDGDSSGNGRRVIERVMERPLARIKPSRIEPAMRRIIAAEVDKQTGLVTLRVRHPDSAVVRRIASRLVTSAGQTYIDVVRAQASGQRLAEAARLDSAERQLHGAEQKLAAFAATNRAYAAYAPAAIARERVERELSNARAVQEQARTDLESAIARELEATPAVVIVDPIPTTLLPDSRHVPLTLVLATALGLVVATIVLLVSGEFAREQMMVHATRSAVDRETGERRERLGVTEGA